MALRILARINRMWLMLGAAIALGLIATWLSVNYLRTREARIAEEIANRQKGGPTIAVVVPTKDLPRGTVLNDSVVAARPIAADLVYEEMITADQFDRVVGLRLLRPVQHGRALRRGDMFDERGKDFSDQIESGARAITIETDELNSISQMLRPGNIVDLYLIAADTSGSGQQVVPLLERVKVVATGQRLRMADPQALPDRPSPGAQTFTTVTVEVTPREAARIALAQQSGRIRAVLRNPGDGKNGDFGRLTTANLMRLGGLRDGKSLLNDGSVEFIIGGKGGGGAGAPININIPSVTIPGITPPPTAEVSPGQSSLFAGTPASGMIPNVPSGAAPR
jgi:pilus assembly protein CpaB